MAKELSCIDCAVTNCNTMDKVYPDFCLTTHMNEEAMEETMSCYREEVNQKIAVASAEVEHEGYCRLTRVEEIIEFARKMEVKKIGIATCVGLIRESRTLAKILRAHGFEVYGVGCKVGAVPKTEIGIPKECTEVGTNMCNPILQAKLLNAAKTDLNVVVGLCVDFEAVYAPGQGQLFHQPEHLGGQPPALHGVVQGQPVDHHVGLFAEPPALDAAVGGLPVEVGAEIAHAPAVLHTQVAPPPRPPGRPPRPGSRPATGPRRFPAERSGPAQ